MKDVSFIKNNQIANFLLLKSFLIESEKFISHHQSISVFFRAVLTPSPLVSEPISSKFKKFLTLGFLNLKFPNLKIKILQDFKSLLMKNNPPFLLEIFLVETAQDLKNPPTIVHLSAAECEDYVENIRNKIYTVLSQDPNPQNPLEWKKKYKILLGVGKLLSMKNKFSQYLDKNLNIFPPLYFSSKTVDEFLIKKQKQADIKKLEQHKQEEIKNQEVILKSLRNPLQDLKAFNEIVSPKFQRLLDKLELELKSYKLGSLEVKFLHDEIKCKLRYLSLISTQMI